MTQPESTLRRPGLWRALAVTAVAGASAATIALPPISAVADPVPPTTTAAAPAAPAPAPADPNAPAPAPAPVDPNAAPAPAPAPVDPNAPPPPPAPVDPNAPPPPPAPVDPNAPAAPAPPPADPNAPPPPPADPNAPPPPPADPNAPVPAPAPEVGRVTNAAGGFSYVVPAGWEVADASRLSYGQALLLKQTAPAAIPGQPGPTANDTSILLGRLDLKLFAGAEADNNKAAVRLASDMGEFFMPFPGTRINQQTTGLQAADMPGAGASYDVKFTDTAKPNGQIWAGVVGTAANPATSQRNERWFVVWLGTAKDPIDTVAAKALAQSIRPYTPPPAPAPDPAAPAAPPAPGNRVGVPIPVETPVPEMMPAG